MDMSSAVRPAQVRWWSAVLAWALWVLVMLGLPAIAWLDQLLRQAGRPELTWSQVPGVPFLVAAVSAATVGTVLAGRRPRHPVGWLLVGLGLSLTVHGVTYVYVRHGLLARPGALAAADYLAGFSAGTVVSWLACAGFVLLLTPTGKLPSPRWRWWARVAAAAPTIFLLGSVMDPAPLYPDYPRIGNPLAVAPALVGPLRTATGITLAVTVLGLPIAAASLVVRFRRARGTERQQLRWLALAAALAPLALLVTVAGVDAGNWAVANWAAGLYLTVPPLATGAAILRYRLYDLDRIISRTLAYGLLTLLLGLGYAGMVLGLGEFLGRESSLVVAGATLAVAGVFQPARRRIQRVVDRRFNRRRYDTAQTIAAFSTRLQEELDLDTLTGELLAVAKETMQPTQASLWLRPSPTPPAPPGRCRSVASATRASENQVSAQASRPARRTAPSRSRADLQGPEATTPRRRPLHLPSMPTKPRG